MKTWYLIHSKPKQEFLAQQNLERQGYETYLPCAVIRSRKRGRSISEKGSMFPRYLFIALSEDNDDWGPIRSTIGVAKLVRFGQIPARIPTGLISLIRARENDNGVIEPESVEYKRGDKIRIAEGPFEGYEAIFQSKTSKDRVVVLLQIVEKEVNIDIKQGDIDKLS